MTYFRFFFLFLLLPFVVNAQSDGQLSLQPLTKADSITLSKIPELKLSDISMRRLLPPVVDNSLLPYMRPLIGQVGLECGQASSIGVMFTYEINAARRVLGTLPQNQYATHFTYNFLNGGSDAGINYFESMQIVKYAGNPNVVDYGGMASGGASRWMSGYDKYYNAMQNRVDGIYSIRTNTLEGLQTLKNWIYDHGNGSENGGMASFYSQFTSPPELLPPGTPEAGRHVIYSWGSSPNHAMAIVGYHDSIRWDYNDDGQYTNHLDINGDGLIDIRDWEIGGFKMANTYGSISGWGDAGFSYMMYKTVADISTQGGIWNNQVIVIDVKENYTPQLTAKVSLTYPCRNKLKLMAGVSNDPMASEPEFVQQYPMFDFQGGCQPMQGNSGGATIEVGLDLNYLLSHVEPGQNVRFFFMVVENDEGGASQGTINSFTLIDYTNGIPQEIPATLSNVSIQNNTVTTIGISIPVNFEQVEVVTDDVPPFELYQNSEVQLLAEGGQDPYSWYLLDAFDTINSTSTFPEINGNPVSVSGNDEGTGAVELPFSFPFYGKEYDKIYVAVDGFIMFEPSLVTWPYYIAGKTYVIQNKIIAPALSKPFYVNGSAGDGIWAELGPDAATIRWKLSVYGQSGNSEVSMAARLHKDGRIELFYGTHLAASYIARFAGISNGDGENMLLLNKTGYFVPYAQQHTTFMPHERFNNLKLTKKGLLSATIDSYTPGRTITVLVSDQNNIRKTAALPIEVQGVVMDYTVNAGGDEVVEYGEDVRFNFHFENKNPVNLGTGTLQLTGEDTYISIVEGQVDLPSLAVDASVELSEIFLLEVSPDVPDLHKADFTLNYTTAEGSWSRNISITAYAPNLHVLTVSVNDGENGILEPGETANLVIRMRNNGGGKLQDVDADLSTNDQDLTILSGTASISQLLPMQIWEAVFQVELSADATPMQVVELLLNVVAANGYNYQKGLPLMTSLIVENFESGAFEIFDWQMSGDAPWTITTVTPYEGTYAARSGVIGDDMSSNLVLSYEVAFADTISYYYKVSTESNYDYLKFSVNGEQLDEWSGEVPWSRAVYVVDAGEQTFRWRYEKDYSVSSGSDCVWIDYVVLPAVKIYTSVEEQSEDKSFELLVGPNPFKDQLLISVKAHSSEPFSLVVTDAKGSHLFGTTVNATDGQLYQINPTHELGSNGLIYIVLQYGNQRIVKPVIRASR